MTEIQTSIRNSAHYFFIIWSVVLTGSAVPRVLRDRKLSIPMGTENTVHGIPLGAVKMASSMKFVTPAGTPTPAGLTSCRYGWSLSQKD